MNISSIFLRYLTCNTTRIVRCNLSAGEDAQLFSGCESETASASAHELRAFGTARTCWQPADAPAPRQAQARQVRGQDKKVVQVCMPDGHKNKSK